MTIATIQVSNVDSPDEVQNWLNAHPSAIIVQFVMANNVFYILYK